jgi:hypothetical protein
MFDFPHISGEGLAEAPHLKDGGGRVFFNHQLGMLGIPYVILYMITDEIIYLFVLNMYYV